MSTARTMGGKESQPRYCLGQILAMSQEAPSLMLDVCVLRVCEQILYLTYFPDIVNNEKSCISFQLWIRDTGETMLMLCEGTLTLTHGKKQLWKLNYSAHGKSKENGVGNGRMCEENIHTTPRIGEEEEETIGKQPQWGLIPNSINKYKPRVSL